MNVTFAPFTRCDDKRLHSCGVAPALDARGAGYCVSLYVKADSARDEKKIAQSIIAAMNARDDALQAMGHALRLLDSVAFVAREGDTDAPMRKLRDAMHALQGA